MIYWLNLLSLPIEYYLIGKLHLQKSQRILTFLFIVFLQWWLIASLRDISVGWDTPTYESYFIEINNFNLLVCISVLRLEPLYIALNNIVGSISIDFRIFLCVVACIIYGLIIYRIRRYSRIIWLSCWLFVAFGFYNFSINILRQSIALAVIIYSFEYIVERRFWKFICCVIIATLFHYTAIVFIVTYFIYKIPTNPKNFVLLITGVLITIALLLPYFMDIIISFNPYYNQHIGENSNKGYGMMAMLSATSICSLILLNKKQLNRYDQLWMVMIFLATAFQCFALKISILVRVVYYWQISIIFLFPTILKLTKSSNRLLIGSFVIIVSILYYALYSINSGDVNGTVPYKLSF